MDPVETYFRELRDIHASGAGAGQTSFSRHNTPQSAREYILGGYQVIKKWLSYRERKLLGRPLRTDEARYATEMARRIAAILMVGEELDGNYASAWGGGK
ncbi:MAG: hypothetical protein BWX88_02651 [Planctomycetes bacterium ADurb.Bin126]|nr:MAG: hypothetical protein BWX88_02651 [Planctomycetes bacterium ADurb.Bin126]